ncbi:MAG: GNAT family N-acetyltransferase [Anaerococcus sp.]|nr:GNAT family N-acetyltransferase [Anaerococcus sp.]MDY2918270.1 GNAT family N-acetyltransferase [Anaerococcus sp.]
MEFVAPDKNNKEDIEFLLQLYNDPLVKNEGLNSIDNTTIYKKDIINTIEYFELHNYYFYIINYNNIKCGIIMIYDIKGSSASLGIAISEKFRNKSIARSAFNKVFSFLKLINIYTIYGLVYKDNVISRKLVKHFDFEEGPDEFMDIDGKKIYYNIFTKHL